MSKVIKISDSTSLKLKELMKALEETGCSEKEKMKVRKIFKIYLDGKAELNEWENTIIRITHCWVWRNSSKMNKSIDYIFGMITGVSGSMVQEVKVVNENG